MTAQRVAVFLDYQNVHLTGHSLFGRGEPYRNVPEPSQLADLLVSRRLVESTAAAIRVYRGQPSPDHQPIPAAVNNAQAAEWTRDQRVQMITRPLVYRSGRPPYEKGIDVAIAVDLMHCAFRKLYDALILFSGDTDLMPVLETVCSLNLTRLEVASWRRGAQRRGVTIKESWGTPPLSSAIRHPRPAAASFAAAY